MVRQTGKFFRTSALMFLVVVLAGCASKPDILSDYDRAADFASFETWDFIKDAGPDYDGYESLFSQYMTEAIEIEMNKR